MCDNIVRHCAKHCAATLCEHCATALCDNIVRTLCDSIVRELVGGCLRALGKVLCQLNGPRPRATAKTRRRPHETTQHCAIACATRLCDHLCVLVRTLGIHLGTLCERLCDVEKLRCNIVRTLCNRFCAMLRKRFCCGGTLCDRLCASCIAAEEHFASLVAIFLR